MGRRTKRFALSGFRNSDEQSQLVYKIQKLGGIFLLNYSHSCTHVICAKITKTEKFLSGCAQGIWILNSQFVEDSFAKKQWVDEEPYEWSEATLESPSDLTDAMLDLYKAPRRNRLNVEKSGRGGLFHNWVFAMALTDKSTCNVYTRILNCGGAKAYRQKLSSAKLKYAKNLTHVFLDHDDAKLQRMLDKVGVFCLDTDYIRNYILLERKPSKANFVYGRYRPNTDSFFNVSFDLSQSQEIKPTPSILETSNVLNVIVENTSPLKSLPIVGSPPISSRLRNEHKKRISTSKPTGMLSLKNYFQPIKNEKVACSDSPETVGTASKRKCSLKENVAESASPSKRPRRSTQSVTKTDVLETSAVVSVVSDECDGAPMIPADSIKVEKLDDETSAAVGIKQCTIVLEDVLSTSSMSSHGLESINVVGEIHSFKMAFRESRWESIDVAEINSFKMAFRESCWYDVFKTRLSSQSDFLEKQACVLAKNLTSMAMILYEEKFWHEAVKDVTMLVTPYSYLPQCLLVASIKVLIMEDPEELTRLEAYENCCARSQAAYLLGKSVSLHPPSTTELRWIYRDVLNEISDHRIWDYIARLIMLSCEENVEGHKSHLKLLKFIVRLLVEDFRLFIARSSDPAADLFFTNRRPLIAHVLWRPSDQLLKLNSRCSELMRLLVDNVQKARDLELRLALQYLVAAMVECLNGCLLIPTEAGSSLAQAFASIVRGFELSAESFKDLLNWIQVPWFKLTLCSEYLKHYIPDAEREAVVSLSLKTIVNTYMKMKLQQNRTRVQETQTVVQIPRRRRLRQSVLAVGTPQLSFLSSPVKRNVKGETDLHLAARKNDLEKLKSLLNDHKTDINFKDSAGWTPLHDACSYGSYDCVNELLGYHSIGHKSGNRMGKTLNIVAKSVTGATALHEAVLNEHHDIVALMLQHGGRQLLKAKMNNGATALQIAKTADMKRLLSSEMVNRNVLGIEHTREQFGSLPFTDIDRYVVIINNLLSSYLEVFPSVVTPPNSYAANLATEDEVIFCNLSDHIDKFREHIKSMCSVDQFEKLTLSLLRLQMLTLC